jgi:hypothetical protein
MPQVEDVNASNLAGKPVYVGLQLHAQTLFGAMCSGYDAGDAVTYTYGYYQPQTSPGGSINTALWTPQPMLLSPSSDSLTTWTSAYLDATDRAAPADSKGEFTPWYVAFDLPPLW